MEIPLTSFVDFVLKSGSPKLTCAKQIKQQMSLPYDPAADYYKRFRDAVLELHSKDHDKKILSRLIGGLPDNKLENYEVMIANYKKFIGNKAMTWFEPQRKNWKYNNIEIPINPELGLEWNGERHLIKMYLKSEKPSKDRVSSILALMNETLPTRNYIHGVLDVRNNKLYSLESNMANLIPLVKGEADSLESILKQI